VSRDRAAAEIERQAEACASLGSPLYAALLGHAAQDVRDGGPCAEALAGYEDAPRADAVALRLLGGVHALVLTGRAPALAAHYPSAGGAFDPVRPDAAWPAFRAAVGSETARVREWMTGPPQTNEVGRANLLIAGLLRAVAATPLPVRLFELGSSAGLNLRADHFRYTSEDFSWGPPDSPVVLEHAWTGTPARPAAATEGHPPLTVVERRGCDVHPVDPLSPEGALALRAYVWPDQTERAARLDGALRLAAAVPADVEAVGAADFLAGIRPEPGTLTVVWHSVMRQYVPAAEWTRVERELERLAAAGPEFAHISFEPPRGDGPRFLLTVRSGTDAPVAVAEAPPHGLPARGLEGLNPAAGNPGPP